MSCLPTDTILRVDLQTPVRSWQLAYASRHNSKPGDSSMEKVNGDRMSRPVRLNTGANGSAPVRPVTTRCA